LGIGQSLGLSLSGLLFFGSLSGSKIFSSLFSFSFFSDSLSGSLELLLLFLLEFEIGLDGFLNLLKIFSVDLVLGGGNLLVKGVERPFQFALENLVVGNLILSTSYLCLECGSLLLLLLLCSLSGEFLFHFSGNSGLLGGLISHALSVSSLLFENGLGTLIDICVGCILDGNTILGNGGSVSSQLFGILDDLNVGLFTISLSSVLVELLGEVLDLSIVLLHLGWISDGLFTLKLIVKSFLVLLDTLIKGSVSILDLGNFRVCLSDKFNCPFCDGSELGSVRTSSSEGSG
jgi:hypothetical protein